MTSSTQPAAMFIEGQWVGSAEHREVLDPGTGRPFATAPIGGADHARAAIAAARRAFDEGAWRAASVQDRAGLLRRVADAIAERNLELIELDCRNVGTPIRQGRDHLGLVPGVFRYYANLIEERESQGPESIGTAGSVVRREPVGVVAAIAPWNYPLWLASAKTSAAIAAGCTVVLKPASLTPLSAIDLARAFETAGAPDGVFNLVLGPSATVGEVLTSDPRVDKVSFTGGTDAGLSVARTAMGGTAKRVSLELGGKSPNIIFADADLDRALDGALIGIFANQGEVCSAGSRLLLERSVRDEFVDRMVEATRRLCVGYEFDEATDIGPLISAEHRDQVAGAVARAVSEGARLLTGGDRKIVDGYEEGFYYEPTIFDDVTPGMAIVREEVFGPVLAIQTFTDEREAIALANGTDYGLAAGIWSQDETRWQRVARDVRAGVVFINSYHSAGIEVPWGGFKMSGIGRELGTAGLDGFTEAKSVVRVPA
jgi:betaine-aldehyde dehydrogenase